MTTDSAAAISEAHVAAAFDDDEDEIFGPLLIGQLEVQIAFAPVEL